MRVTPLLFIDTPGDSDDIVLLYGHYDEQPEFKGWRRDVAEQRLLEML